MGELSTYELIHFFPFSPQVLLRLYERAIEQAGWAVWLAVLATVGLVVAYAVLRPRVSAAFLALATAATGYTFVWSMYAELNWVGTYAAAAFGAEVVLLAGAAARGELEIGSARRWAAAGLTAATAAWGGLASLVGIAPATELLGITPDITAFSAVVFAGAVRGRASLLLAVIPLTWLVSSGLTWFAMDLGAGLVIPVAGWLVFLGFIGVDIARGSD